MYATNQTNGERMYTTNDLSRTVNVGADFENPVKVFFDEDHLLRQEKGSVSNIVHPQFYDSERKRRRSYDELSVSTLVLKSANHTYYIELQINEDLDEVPVHFNDGVTKYFHHKSRCHFHGQIISKPRGLVAISACSKDGKMTGVIMMEEKVYFLSPISKSNDVDESNKHYLQEYGEEKAEFCGINTNPAKSTEFEQENSLENPYEEWLNNNRVKRETKEPSNRKVIEVAVFVDRELYNNIRATSTVDASRSAVSRVLAIMNQVQLIYNYSTLETKFKIVIVKIQILRSNQDVPNTENGNIDKYLDNFCIWQSKLNSLEENGRHWDHALMLSGLNLYKEIGGIRSTTVLGLAWVSGMCRSNYTCTINEGTNFEAAFVIAHEIAHSLGVRHDGNGNNCDSTKFLMSDKTGAGKVRWSNCSNVYIQNFFRDGKGLCLSDDASPTNKSFDLESRSLPGLRYSLTDQCRLALGSGYKALKSSKERFNNVCHELWCIIGIWAKPVHPALDGSPCGEGKLCLEGLCSSSALASNSTTTITSSSNSTSKTIPAGTARNIVTTESGGILRKIQETVMKTIRSLG